MPKKIGSVTVLGGGIGGMQAALDLADSGLKVYLVETNPGIGGVMSKLDKTFPTNDCAMCTMAPRLVEISRHKDIDVISNTELIKIEGKPGRFKVTLKNKARFVDLGKCTGCGTCTEHCPVRNHIQLIPAEERSKVTIDPDTREIVSDIIRTNKHRKGPLMPILQEVSARLSYFPEEVLRFISQETGYPLAHICRIATFYSAFSLKPVGKYIINVCMGTTCYVRGAQTLMERFSDVLEINENETSRDKLFTLRTVRCIGCCGLAPVVTIGEDVHKRLAGKNIPKIIKKYINKEKELSHA